VKKATSKARQMERNRKHVEGEKLRRAKVKAAVGQDAY